MVEWKPVPTIWDVPDDLWERIGPVILEYSAAPVLALRWTVALQDLGDLVGIEEWGNRAGDVVLPAEARWGKSVCRGKCV